MTFVESYSYLGACCSFNYNPKAQDLEEFFRVNSFGVNGGLSVIGTGRPQASDGKSGAVYSEGFVVLVHHSNDFAVESAPTTYLPLSAETFIDVQPIHSSCSDQVLGLPFPQRKCIIPSDLRVKNYRQPECMLGCLRNEIHKRCGCHPFHLPKSDNETRYIRDCRAKDVNCFVINYCELSDKLMHKT
jgi:acid-sensing ion channel, other